MSIDLIEVGVTNGQQAADRINAAIEAINDGTQYIEITITAGQLALMHSVPIVLIPAPGAGKVIVPSYGSCSYVYGSEAYDVDNPAIYFAGNSTIVDAALASILYETEAFVKLSHMSYSGSSIGGPTSEFDNKALILTDTADPTTGDGSLLITLWYAIASL